MHPYRPIERATLGTIAPGSCWQCMGCPDFAPVRTTCSPGKWPAEETGPEHRGRALPEAVIGSTSWWRRCYARQRWAPSITWARVRHAAPHSIARRLAGQVDSRDSTRVRNQDHIVPLPPFMFGKALAPKLVDLNLIPEADTRCGAYE